MRAAAAGCPLPCGRCFKQLFIRTRLLHFVKNAAIGSNNKLGMRQRFRSRNQLTGRAYRISHINNRLRRFRMDQHGRLWIQRFHPRQRLGFKLIMNNAGALPDAVMLVIGSAFTGHAATGGFIGAGIMLAIQSGVARGVFSNESGLGSAPIAAAAAKTDSCVEQGLVSMTGTFIDTIIICTMTGLTLVVTGVWSGDASGAAMTSLAFAQGLDAHVGQYLVSIGLLFFAFTTILGWNYYGERCTEYLFGVKAIKPYRLVYLALVASGAFLHLDMIWLLADIVNGLMAVPNLIGLIGLRHVVIAETRAYFSRDLDSEAEPEPQTA